MITDIWARLYMLFAPKLNDIYPAIEIKGLTPELQETILRRVLTHMRDFEPILDEVETGLEVYPQSVGAIIYCLASPRFEGMVWVETEMDYLVLPQIGLRIPDSQSLIITYIMGTWTPVTLIGLMELLRWIHDLSDGISIEMEQETVSKGMRQLFDRVWRDYLNDTVEARS